MSGAYGSRGRRHELRAEALALGYGGDDVVRDLDLLIPDRRITAVIGANACGKSTLLKGLARLLKPRRGAVYLDGRAIHEAKTIQVAAELGLLPQEPTAPDGIVVGDLVGRGRYPHQRWFRQWNAEDEAAVAAALQATGTAGLVDRRVQDLSGGQRQRVWVAMALAQETDVLLLDEPTSFLDINHQIELLDLLVDLNRGSGKTIVLVLHDLNLACRYADHVITMRDGRIFAQGPPAAVIDADTVGAVFGVECQVVADPVSGTPLVVPRGRHEPANPRAVTAARAISSRG
jgi:iron complex transport system ATP-binding protein